MANVILIIASKPKPVITIQNTGIKDLYKNLDWFTANPDFVLSAGQKAHKLQTGQYKLGDGVTQLQSLEFLGSSGEAAWGNISGDITDQTDLVDYVADQISPIQQDVSDLQTEVAGKQDALGFTPENVANKVNDLTDSSSTTKYPTVKAAADANAATLASANAYTDAAVTTVFRPVGGWDASGGTFPTVGSGTVGAVRRGDTYNVTVAGTLGGEAYDIGDNFYANTNNPGQTASNWSRFESNTQQATEVVRGTARIATQATIEDNASTNDTDIVTVKKFWLGILRFLTLYKDTVGGIVGLTGQEINFKNAIGTITSYLANANSSSRTYIFQDRSGTIADDTDLAAKAPINNPAFTGSTFETDALAGTGDRVVQSDSGGNLTASATVIDAVISNATIITQITTGGNWTGVNYTGSAITGLYAGQYYYTSTYYYFAVADNTIIRMARA